MCSLWPEPIDVVPPPAPKKKKLVTFLKKEQSEQVASTCTYTPLQKLKSEIDAYKVSPKLEVDSDETPLQWWKSHETTYPMLSNSLAVEEFNPEKIGIEAILVPI